MKTITKNNVTYSVLDENAIPHIAIATSVDNDIEKVTISEFVTIDDVTFLVTEIGENFVKDGALLKKIYIPSTIKKIYYSSFVSASKELIIDIDYTQIPNTFENNWYSDHEVILTDKSKLDAFFSSMDENKKRVDPIKLYSGEKDKPKYKSILSAEGLSQRAKHWKTKNVVIVFTVVAVLFIGIGLLVGFLLKK